MLFSPAFFYSLLRYKYFPQHLAYDLQFVCLPCHLFNNTIIKAKKQLLLQQSLLRNWSKLWKITRGKNFIPLKAKLLHRNYIIT